MTVLVEETLRIFPRIFKRIFSAMFDLNWVTSFNEREKKTHKEREKKCQFSLFSFSFMKDMVRYDEGNMTVSIFRSAKGEESFPGIFYAEGTVIQKKTRSEKSNYFLHVKVSRKKNYRLVEEKVRIFPRIFASKIFSTWFASQFSIVSKKIIFWIFLSPFFSQLLLW